MRRRWRRFSPWALRLRPLPRAAIAQNRRTRSPVDAAKSVIARKQRSARRADGTCPRAPPTIDPMIDIRSAAIDGSRRFGLILPQPELEFDLIGCPMEKRPAIA